ncbi:MAG: right-handed parallel beta-helix repeat-containing protein, partial [Bacteroidales bacterium]
GAGSLFNIKNAAEVQLKDLIVSDFKKIAIIVGGASSVQVENCLFKDNKDAKATGGNNGGVMRVSSSKVILKNSIFTGNSGNGGYGGGAVCVYGASDLRAENCTFTANSAAVGGAALSVKATGTKGELLPPKAYIANCTFANNIADLRGALYLVSECTHAEKFSPVVVNCTFVGNLAEKEGAAVCLWSKASTSLNVTMVNNLFAENYITPWNDNSGEKCDVWAFYLAGEVNNVNEPLPQTVYQDCVTNLYEAAKPGFFDNKNTVIDFSKVVVFKDVEQNPLDLGDEFYTHKTSKLHGNLMVAMIAENSVAKNAGTKTYKTVEIPVTDQLGKTRPATPSVGAVEFGDVIDGLGMVTSAGNIQVIASGKELRISGIENQSQVQVYDLTGALVWTGIVENNEVINLSSVAMGIYGVQVVNGMEKTTAKVIIR